jgi:hypothetical protein
MYGYLADLIVAFHVGYVAFVVLGLVAILLGAALRWRWVRNPYFRCVHLAMIVIVALEAALGWVCPLTRWETELRALAGQESAEGSFMGRLLHRLIFLQLPEWAFTPLHIGFALLVLATFWLAPVRWRRPRPGPNEGTP